MERLGDTSIKVMLSYMTYLPESTSNQDSGSKLSL